MDVRRVSSFRPQKEEGPSAAINAEPPNFPGDRETTCPVHARIITTLCSDLTLHCCSIAPLLVTAGTQNSWSETDPFSRCFLIIRWCPILPRACISPYMTKSQFKGGFEELLCVQNRRRIWARWSHTKCTTSCRYIWEHLCSVMEMTSCVSPWTLQSWTLSGQLALKTVQIQGLY